MKNLNEQKVMEELESFRLEYPEFDDEIVSDYVALLDDFTPAEKSMFIRKLGY